MILDQLPAVQALPTDEKWQLLDELWRDLARKVENSPPDPKTVAVLEEREAEYRANPDAVKTWEEVRAQLAAYRHSRYGNI
jgi:putative addiction module component (TIGR02574 family)